MYLIVDFCVKQILGIFESQIETKRILSLARILISLKRCHLQLKNLEILIFFKKNWPNDPKIGCKSPSSLVDLIETNLNLEEKFEKFEKASKRDKVVEL